MRATFLALALLCGISPAGDATLTLKKSGYSLSVAGDVSVTRWNDALFTLGGMRADDRVIWARTLPEKGAYADNRMRIFWQSGPKDGTRQATFALSIWEDPGQRMRLTALVFRAGTQVPKWGHLKKCDVRLDLEVRVASGQSATTLSGDLIARLGVLADRECVHTVELYNTGDDPLDCELRIIPEDGRRGVRAMTTATVPSGARKRVKLDGELAVRARWHACRIEIRVRGRKDILVLHPRPWIRNFGHRRNGPVPPPPPPKEPKRLPK